MTGLLFVFALATLFAAIFYWGFRRLPAEDWQIMATVPFKQQGDGSWQGVNLTYYGFFNASACVCAAAIIIFLMGSIGVPTVATVIVVGALLLICIPAAKVVARLVERKQATFTVGGASFVGIVLLPLLIQLFNHFVGPRLGVRVPVTQTLAAAVIAYAFGEAFGRLACISFGCCYGKLLSHAPLPIQKVLGSFCFIFKGETKKVAYAGDMIGMPVIPIQGVTAIISTLAGLSGMFLFLRSQWTAAVLVPLATTQIWRVLSETLRADYRGGGRLSAYQIMAMVGLVYAAILLLQISPTATVAPSLVTGLRALASAPVLLVLELLWIAIFLFVGRSSVTAARISFHVVRERI